MEERRDAGFIVKKIILSLGRCVHPLLGEGVFESVSISYSVLGKVCKSVLDLLLEYVSSTCYHM
jgi:hypothetical protein